MHSPAAPIGLDVPAAPHVLTAPNFLVVSTGPAVPDALDVPALPAVGETRDGKDREGLCTHLLLLMLLLLYLLLLLLLMFWLWMKQGMG